jgi:hypothetical protein
VENATIITQRRRVQATWNAWTKPISQTLGFRLKAVADFLRLGSCLGDHLLNGLGRVVSDDGSSDRRVCCSLISLSLLDRF